MRTKRIPQPSDPVTRSQSGFTLLELIVAIMILSILTSAAIPIYQKTIIRQREAELRRDLREMRSAIDRYKDTADRNLIQTAVGSEGYPPDLETLVKGITYAGDQKMRFLRRIPVDPMTGHKDWSLRAVQDDPDSDSGGGDNAFDVRSNSQATALDGTKYSSW